MMTERELHAVPVPTLRRLPSYLAYLKSLQSAGRDVVSCTHIADHLGLDPTQVRKDIQAAGVLGKPKVGYYLPALIEGIEAVLGWNNVSEAFLVGAGSLGTALMGYEGFRDHGLNIVAAFDTDPEKIGTEIHGKKVLPLKKLPNLVERMHIQIGIITVPGLQAQEVATMMTDAGIVAVWNFAPAHIEVPEGTILENVQLAASLAVLSSKLAARLKASTS